MLIILRHRRVLAFFAVTFLFFVQSQFLVAAITYSHKCHAAASTTPPAPCPLSYHFVDTAWLLLNSTEW